MDQEISFCPTRHGTVALSVTGDGPALVFPSWWVSHLEVGSEEPRFSGWIGALAERHTVVRYDRIGTGMSARPGGDAILTIDEEVEVLGLLLDHLGLGAVSIFGLSFGGGVSAAFAAAHPERVKRLVLYGSYADGERITDEESRRNLVSLVESHWGVGSRVLSAIFAPEGDAAAMDWFTRVQRAAATPRTAARLLELVYSAKAGEAYRGVRAPTLVMHRRDDRAIPYELGVEVASLVPGAQFVPLEGSLHLPWLGDSAAVLAALSRFMHLGDYALESPAAPHGGAAELSGREREILALVAEGLSDREIAERLVLSPHTVHRHVANIRAKLDQPSRAAAAAAAARLGLI
jgi:pimeloyl-ACP methyl ester carboxylesterase/DNA-binding CsgD family transcriptional regulator